MQKWEYKREVGDEKLDALGKKGWELVDVFDKKGKQLLYFKRPAKTFKQKVGEAQKRKVIEQLTKTE